MSTGRYHRFSLFNERRRRVSVLLQSSENGNPIYVESADFTDWARITRSAVRRVAAMNLDGVRGAEAWKLLPSGVNNNFEIQGGDNTDLGAKEAWLSGNCALLYRTIDYQCLLHGGGFDLDAFDIHHRATKIEDGVLTDERVKFYPDRLVGFTVHVEGYGDFEIAGNTNSTITLVGFVADPDNPNPWYFINLKASVADMDQAVYLDVHLEDWGMVEDPDLNHNIGGTPVECCRREVLIQRLWVQQNPDKVESPVVNYKDAGGVQHFVTKIGTLARVAGNEGIAGPDIINNRNEFASSAEEVEAARHFAHFDVGVDHDGDGFYPEQPVSLPERLAREDSWIVVGPVGDPGIYTGASGLKDALALPQPHTIFLRNGIYDFATAGLGTLVVPDRWTIIGESKFAMIVPDDDHTMVGMKLQGRARLENLSVYALATTITPMLQMTGRLASIRGCWLASSSTSASASVLHVLHTKGGAGGPGGCSVENCSIRKLQGRAILVDVETSAFAASQAERTDSEPFSVLHEFSGSPPVGSDISPADSYGVRFSNCRIYSAGASSDPSGEVAAMVILGGADVDISSTTFRGDGCSALRIKGVDSVTSVSTVTLRDCTFLAYAMATTDFSTVALTYQSGGFAEYQGCKWDILGYDGSVKQWPKHMCLVRLGNAGDLPTGGASFIGGRITAVGASNGLSTSIRSDGTLIQVQGMRIQHLGDETNAHLLATSTAGLGSLTSVSEVALRCGAGTTLGAHLCGATMATLRIDGTQVGTSNDPDVLMTSGSSGIRVDSIDWQGVDLHEKACDVNLKSCSVVGFGQMAVACIGVSSYVEDLQTVNIENLLVDGAVKGVATTSMGVYIHRKRVNIKNAKMSELQLSGVYDTLGCAGMTRVDGLDIAGFGRAYQDIAASASKAAATAGCRASQHIEASDGHTGVVLWGGERDVKVPVTGNFHTLTFGVYVSNAFLGDAQVSGDFRKCSEAGVNFIEQLIGRMEVSGSSFYDSRIHAVATSGLKIRATSMSADDHYCMVLDNCTDVTISQVEITTQKSSRIALFMQNCRGVRVDTSEINGGASAVIYATECVSFQMVNVVVNTEFVTPKGVFTSTDLSHGIHLLKCTNVTLDHVTSPAGAHIPRAMGHVVVKDFESNLAGLISYPDDDSSTVQVIRSQMKGNSSACPEARSALWLAPLNTGGHVWDSAVVDSCELISRSGMSHSLTEDLTTGRAACVVVNANRVEVFRNSLVDSSLIPEFGLSALVGNLNYIAGVNHDADNHRIGCVSVSFCDNRIYDRRVPVVLVLEDSYCHEVCRNVFGNGNGIGAESFPAEGEYNVACLLLYTLVGALIDDSNWTRVIYIGNEHKLPDRVVPDMGSTWNNAWVQFSDNVLIDAHLNATQWADYPNGGDLTPFTWVAQTNFLNSVIVARTYAEDDSILGDVILDTGLIG